MDKCHFIGIGGIGMSGLAKILLNKNVPVSGSDLSESAITKTLHQEGAQIFIGQNEKNIDAAMTVIYSSGINKNNPEYQAALNKNCSMLHRSELLYKLMSEFKALAVAGTHGKTTTTSLLTTVFHEGALDPSFAVGGIVKQFGTNACLGKGSYFIAEADESDGTFLRYHPEGAIITNISMDHMDHFVTIEAVMNAYRTFANQVKNPELLFWCGDDERLASLKLKGKSYGFKDGNDVQGSNFRQQGWKLIFDITFEGKTYSDVEVALTGKHNALNALGVFGIALQAGVPIESIRKAFLQFGGVMRRCEKKGVEQGVLVLDDYAHHPKEINATLLAMRSAVEEKRLIVLFQPHRYSRTEDCLGTYGSIFNNADMLFVTDIYSAGETPRPGITNQRIIDEVKEKFRGPIYPTSRKDLIQNVLPHLRPHDVVVTMGAGDITYAGGELLNALKTYPIKKWQVGLVCGGRSMEHEISLRSAKFIYESLNRDFYDVSIFGITKAGQWSFYPAFPTSKTIEGGAPLSESILKQLSACDIIVPALHGTYGEDGTIQGFFDILDLAYVGCSHRASAIAMDKAVTKQIMIFNGIPTSPFIDVQHSQWLREPEHVTRMVAEQLRYPVYVKSVHLGSSVGVTRVANESELPAAMEAGFKHDYKVIIENEIIGREIEFSVFGNEFFYVFPPGEIFREEDKVYTYDAKYGSNSFGTATVAELPKEVVEEGMFMAEKAYEAIECAGLARIDFFLDRDNKIWFNEINPIPGFTSISLYPKMCQAHGIEAGPLLDRLIILGLQRKRVQRNEVALV